MKSGKRIRKLATELGMPIKGFSEVFDIEEDMLTVINYVGLYNKDKIQNIALLTLFGYKIFFEQEMVFSQEIRRNVAVNKISLNNYASSLNDLTPRLLRRIGDSRSKEISYRLTNRGENKSKELIKEIIGSSTTIGIHNESNVSSIENFLDNSGLWSACRASFRNEKYWDACLLAFRHLETKIREKTELTAEEYGTNLVTKAFKPSNGILKIPSCAVRSEEDGFLSIW